MDGFESAEPSPSYSPQATPEPAEGDGPAGAIGQPTAVQGPLVHEVIPAPAPAPASQLAGGCSSGEAEAMAPPATPAPALPACVAAPADAPAVASAPDAADEAWKCTFCKCEHEGAEATYLSCKLCNTERAPTAREPPRARRQAAPRQAAPRGSAMRRAALHAEQRRPHSNAAKAPIIKNMVPHALAFLR